MILSYSPARFAGEVYIIFAPSSGLVSNTNLRSFHVLCQACTEKTVPKSDDGLKKSAKTHHSHRMMLTKMACRGSRMSKRKKKKYKNQSES